MSREARSAQRQEAWAKAQAALGRTRAAAAQAQRETTRWPALREQQRAAIMPLLDAWRQQMAELRRPLSLRRIEWRRLGLLAAFGWPSLRPIALWTRLRLAGIAALIVLTWLWQRRRQILIGAALIAAVWLTCAAANWLLDNRAVIQDALRGLLP